MILVTGASGFIGRCLFKELITQFGEHEVIALTSNPNFKENSVYFNFEDHPDSLKEKLKSLPIKIVIHAGAFTQKNKTDLYNWEGPNSNVIFTDILLKSLPNSVEKLIYLSTIDVYKMGDVISEQTAISPNNLYAHSKYYGEKLIETWGLSENKCVQIFRVGHVYGPGEELYQKLIPSIFQKVISNQSPTIIGSGEEVRSFIYVIDLVNYLIQSLSFISFIGPVNLVGSTEVKVVDLVEMILKISNSTLPIVFLESKVVGNNFRFDHSKMKQYFKLNETKLSDGLKLEYNDLILKSATNEIVF